MVQGPVAAGTVAEAITATMVRTVLRAAAATAVLAVATATSGFVPHFT